MKNLIDKIDSSIYDIYVSGSVHINVQLEVDSRIWWRVNNQIRDQVFMRLRIHNHEKLN